LKDRYVLPAQGARSGVPYWDVVDLIEFPREAEPVWIRIGYYRMPKDRLVWGSQTTITEPIAVWRSLLTNAAKGKPWFRKLLEAAPVAGGSEVQPQVKRRPLGAVSAFPIVRHIEAFVVCLPWVNSHETQSLRRNHNYQLPGGAPQSRFDRRWSPTDLP
jgi:hypothetical protein